MQRLGCFFEFRDSDSKIGVKLQFFGRGDGVFNFEQTKRPWDSKAVRGVGQDFGRLRPLC